MARTYRRYRENRCPGPGPDGSSQWTLHHPVRSRTPTFPCSPVQWPRLSVRHAPEYAFAFEVSIYLCGCGRRSGAPLISYPAVRQLPMPTEGQMKRLCVFCGTNPGARPEYGAAARELGRILAEQKIELVYGGASVGIMGELADSMHEHGGQVTGIIPQQLVEKEAAHTGIANLIVVAS